MKGFEADQDSGTGEQHAISAAKKDFDGIFGFVSTRTFPDLINSIRYLILLSHST